MPEKRVVRRARRKAQAGKAPSMQLALAQARRRARGKIIESRPRRQAARRAHPERAKAHGRARRKARARGR
jgi:hypothetical protein